MYGTVARMKVRPGSLDGLRRFAESEANLEIRGYKGTVVYHMDEDPNEIFLAVLFEDRESYMANAESPDQDQRFKEMMKFLAAEPEWHDGEIIFSDVAEAVPC